MTSSTSWTELRRLIGLNEDGDGLLGRGLLVDGLKSCGSDWEKIVASVVKTKSQFWRETTKGGKSNKNFKLVKLGDVVSCSIVENRQMFKLQNITRRIPSFV